MTRSVLLQPSRLGKILFSDALNVTRDPMLLIVLVMTALPPLALAIWRADLDALALQSFGVANFGTYLVPTFLVVNALLIGWVVGFLMLEDRDEGMLTAVAVTPLGGRGYLGYRAALAAALTLLLTLYGIVLMAPALPPAPAALVCLLVALEAVLSAAVLPALARNKVEGLALTKLTNILAIVPLAALLPAPWRYLFGVLPPYWIGEVLLVPASGALPIWLVALLSLLVHAVATALLLARVRR